jgi:hypothetical protein
MPDFLGVGFFNEFVRRVSKCFDASIYIFRTIPKG